MRRYWREPSSARIFRGGELPRLATGIVMLAVLAMLFVRTRDPDMWRWMAPGGGKASEVAPATPIEKPKQAEPLPEAIGPTDEDPDQAEAAREEFQVLTDGTLKLEPEEQLVYDRLVGWVNNQSFARLEGRAKKGLWFADLYGEPDKHRGQLVALDLDVRLVKNLGDNRYGVPLHELWGVTEESRGRLYDAIVLDYPKDMPDNVREKVRLAGYFLKLQGYEPATAKPGQAPERAPLLIGRVERRTVVLTPTDNRQELVVGVVLAAVIGLAWGIQFVYLKRRRKKKTAAPAPKFHTATGEIISLDEWLERSGQNAAQAEDGDDARTGQ
jgi:hypothetical protein